MPTTKRAKAKPKPQEPKTVAEWQEALDQAEMLLRLDACRLYGLITGGPKVNVDRCVELLRRGKAKGYLPSEAGVMEQVGNLLGVNGGQETGGPRHGV